MVVTGFFAQCKILYSLSMPFEETYDYDKSWKAAFSYYHAVKCPPRISNIFPLRENKFVLRDELQLDTCHLHG